MLHTMQSIPKLKIYIIITCVKVEVGNNLTPDNDRTRLADVLVHNWSQGKPAAFDFSVTSLLNLLNLSEAGVSSRAAAEASEIRKHNSNDGKCGDLGWVCIPVVVETYGAWGQEAVKSFGITAGNHQLHAKVYHRTRSIWQAKHLPCAISSIGYP